MNILIYDVESKTHYHGTPMVDAHKALMNTDYTNMMQLKKDFKALKGSAYQRMISGVWVKVQTASIVRLSFDILYVIDLSEVSEEVEIGGKPLEHWSKAHERSPR